MKSSEARDKMVARVHAVFDRYRSFDELPVLSKTEGLRPYVIPLPEFVQAVPKNIGVPIPDTVYATALHAACMYGIVVGRGSGADRFTLFWKPE